jgi:hypothetical protein
MTPKNKANETFLKMYDKIENATVGLFSEDVAYIDARYKAAKQCALIAVDEILYLDIKAKNESQFIIERRIEEYWQEVKQEIENL